MGHYKSRIGFFRKTILKIITRMERISFRGGFGGLFILLNRLHFFIYTGMYLPTAFNERKKVAIGACRRVKCLFSSCLRERTHISEEMVELLSSVAYRVFLRTTMKRSLLDIILIRGGVRDNK